MIHSGFARNDIADLRHPDSDMRLFDVVRRLHRSSRVFDDIRDAMISPRDVARQLRLHISTIHRWMTSGVRGRRLPSRLIGGRRFVIRSDLEEWLSLPEQPMAASDETQRRNHAAQEQLRGFKVPSNEERNRKP